MICTTCKIVKVTPINKRYCSFTCENCKIANMADRYVSVHREIMIEKDQRNEV